MAMPLWKIQILRWHCYYKYNIRNKRCYIYILQSFMIVSFEFDQLTLGVRYTQELSYSDPTHLDKFHYFTCGDCSIRVFQVCNYKCA